MTNPIRYRLFFGIFVLGILLMLIQSAPTQAAEKMKSVDLSTAIIQVAKQNIPAVVSIEVTESKRWPTPYCLSRMILSSDVFWDSKDAQKFKQGVKGVGFWNDHRSSRPHSHELPRGWRRHQNGSLLWLTAANTPPDWSGSDPKTDLAVIHISAKEPLPHVTFGDSDKVEVGEWVVAIGAPRALEKTVTQGIISAKHRRGITDPSSYQDFLQTDAPINPGNSGGPLLNLQGEVIGVNAAIASESGGFEGIGFTIPSNMALHVARALIAYGKVERGWLGVTTQDLTPELAKSVQVETLKGALIADVVKGGPAEKAGIKKNDVVITYRGKEISRFQQPS